MALSKILQNNTSTGYINLPAGTTAQRPSSPVVGMIRFNTTLGYTEEYRNNSWQSISNVFEATGGTESTYSSGGINYKVHTFLANGTFTISRFGTFDSLVVAGGGGGGTGGPAPYTGWAGGGGGAGGYVTTSDSSLGLTLGDNTVTVGGGGAISANGANSVLGNQTAIGGGAGGNGNYPGAGGVGSNGGSGGGGGQGTSVVAGGSGTTGQGNAGNASTVAPYISGGGGGSSAAASGPNAGAGTSNSIRAGTPVTYASGGSGVGTGAINTGAGGANTGNGGQHLLTGGSGIVIIRYAI
jgi:hypothetical protein